MPIIKNPFRRNIIVTNGTPEYGNNSDNLSGTDSPVTNGSKPSLAMDIKNGEAPNEFKMSVVTDGRYLPPSPPERKSFFSRSFHSTPSTHRSALRDEPFSISRESFESYRRSFDISARSPIASPTFPRQSLDARLPRIRQYESLDSQTEEKSSDDEDEFDDVILEADGKPRKKGIFSFGNNNTAKSTNAQNHGFFFGGRKRGLSGQGAELKSMEESKSVEQQV